MHTQLEILWELQQLNQQKVQLLTARKGISTEELRQLWQEVSSLEEAVGNSSVLLSQRQHDCSQLEQQLQQLSEQCQQVETLLYCGRISNIKELEQLRLKHGSLQNEMQHLENRVYESLERCDQMQCNIVSQEEQLQARRMQHSHKQQDMAKQLADIDAKLALIEKQCAELMVKVDPALYSKYASLSRLRPQAVAKLVNGICTGCRLAVPVGQLKSDHAGICCCDNCGRWLLID